MEGLDKNDVQDIIKEYLLDNLRIETKEENGFGDKYVTVSVHLGKEEVSTDTINISTD